jgi:chromosome segregation ATPase
MRKQIEAMIKSETAMLERVLEHDKVLKKVNDLEEDLFFKKELNQDLRREIEKLEFENENLRSYKKQIEEMKLLMNEKEGQISDFKSKLKEQKRIEENLELRNIDLENHNEEWMKELIKLRAKVIELEHINQINLQNNKLLFNAQRIEFSRLNLGRKII